MDYLELPEEFYNILGKIVCNSNLCDNSLLFLINHNDKAKAEKLHFGQKIDKFGEIYNNEFKKKYCAELFNYELIPELLVLNKIRKWYVHGIPFKNGDKISSRKISSDLLEDGLNASDEIIGYSLSELRQIFYGSVKLTNILLNIVAKEHSTQ